jgi:sec-independent protein translocase protein TatA
MGDLFDSPWKIAIIAILIIVLFGAKRLPGAAKSLGQSMRILKTEVTKLHDDDEPATGTSATLPAPAQLAATPVTPSSSEAELRAHNEALQQQLRDLQRAAAMDPVASAKQDAPLNQQS